MKIIFHIITIIMISPIELALAQKIIEWQNVEWPPFTIIQNGHPTNGIYDNVVKYISKNLPQYGHIFIVSNYKRMFLGIKNQNNTALCGVFKVKEREKYTNYSKKPFMRIQPNYAVYKKSNLNKIKPFIQKDGTINIENLIKSKTVKIGIHIGRYYQPLLDNLLNKYNDERIIIKNTSTDVGGGLYRMLYHDRFDLIFDFPPAVQYFTTQHNEFKNEKYLMNPIHNEVKFYEVWLATPKTEWGNTLISQIDNILEQEGTMNVFTDYYSKWLDQKNKTDYLSMVRSQAPAKKQNNLK